MSPIKVEQLVAHRGWQQHYPENTLVSVKKAIEAGATRVEIDIQLSIDLVPYLCHDTDLTRLCNKADDIRQLTSKQLSHYRAYEPARLGELFIKTPLCQLSECVQLLNDHPHVTLYAEIKEESLQTFGTQTCLTKILHELNPIHKRCVIISFDINVLNSAKQSGWQRVGPVLSNWDQFFEPLLIAMAPEVVFCDHNFLAGTNDVSDMPFPVAVYEVGDYPKACQLIARGATFVETFSIGEIIESINTFT